MIKKITLELDEDQAEEILIALARQAKQAYSITEIELADQIGHALAREFMDAFGWDTDVYANHRSH